MKIQPILFAVAFSFVSVLCCRSVFAQATYESQFIEAEEHDIMLKTRGFIEPSHETTITAQVMGQIESVSPLFEPGSRVKKGDLLLSLDKTRYLAEISYSEKALIDAQLTLEDERVKSRRAKEDWKTLHDTHPNELAGRDLHVRAAEANLNAAKAQLNKARRDLELTDIRAAYDGIIQERTVSLGDVLSEGDIAGKYVNSDEAVIEVSLNLGLIDHLYNAEDVKLRVKLFRGNSGQDVIYGYDLRLSPDLVKNEQQAKLRARMPLYPKPGQKLFLNEFVLAEISIPFSKKTFAIPESAFTVQNSVLTVKNGELIEIYPNVIYESDGTKYCVTNEVNKIEVVTHSPGLYRNRSVSVNKTVNYSMNLE